MRALALTPECLECTEGGGDTTPPPSGGGGPNIITRPPTDDFTEKRIGAGGGTVTSTGTPQSPVTVGTSNLPSTGGPKIIAPPPSEAPTAAPAWRKFAIGAALIVAALLIVAPLEKKK